MFDSIGAILMTVASGVAALFAGLWARRVYRDIKDDRDRIQEIHDQVDAAGQRLDEARKAKAKPVDVEKRTDFEGQP